MSSGDVTVRITGVGSSIEVDVEEGQSLADALAEAQINVEDSGLQVKVNGTAVDDPASYNPENGDQAVVTPRDVKLG